MLPINKNHKVGLKLKKKQTSTFKKLRSWHPVPQLHANRRGKAEVVADFIFFGSKITVMVTAAMKLKDAYSLEGK